jgi:hypothetical protein
MLQALTGFKKVARLNQPHDVDRPELAISTPLSCFGAALTVLHPTTAGAQTGPHTAVL